MLHRYISIIVACTVLCLLCLPLRGESSRVIPWKTATYSYTARNTSVSEILTTFSAVQGIGISLPSSLKTVVSGDFHNMPSQEFLERVCGMSNLIWYHDGASLYICTPSEMKSSLLELRYMKADDVIGLLRELQVEDSRFPIVRDAANELIKISGPPRYVELVLELVQRADSLRRSKITLDEDIRIFPLRHAWADDKSLNVSGGGTTTGTTSIPGVATLLRQLMLGREGVQSASVRLPGEPGYGGDGKEASGDEKAASDVLKTHHQGPSILADTRLNAVIVRDAKHRMPYYEALIAKLDVPVRMVEIAVTVLDINQDSMLDWEMRLKALGGRKEISGGIGLDVDNVAEAADLSGLGLAGSLTYLRKDISLLTSIAAMQEKGQARTVSRPSVLTLDNVVAELRDTKSYRVKVVGTEVVELSEVTAGIVLTVQPRIVDLPEREAKEGEPAPPRYEVWMVMRIQDGGFESVTVDSMPMTRTSTLETQAGVQEGQCLLVGGYMHEILEERAWGIPYLRDIPWIGWLFGGIGKEKSTVQRMFLLSPRVVAFGTEDIHPTRSATRMRSIEGELEIEDELRRHDYRRTRDEKKRKERREEEEEAWRKERIEEEKKKVDAKKAVRRQEREARRQEELRREAEEERQEALRREEEERQERLRQEEVEAREADERRKARLERSRREMQEVLEAARAQERERVQRVESSLSAEDRAALEAARKRQQEAMEVLESQAAQGSPKPVAPEKAEPAAEEKPAVETKPVAPETAAPAAEEKPAERSETEGGADEAARRHLERQRSEQESIRRALEESRKK